MPDLPEPRPMASYRRSSSPVARRRIPSSPSSSPASMRPTISRPAWYYLSNLPPRTSLWRLAATVKARWSCEQAHQQLKQELGLGDFEGRSWTGLHRHALMTCIAFAYLQHRRLKAAGRG